MARRVTSLALKLLTLAALVLAIFNVPLWTRPLPRRRVYVVDVSESVRSADAAPDGVSPADALRAIEADARRSLRPEDEVAIVAFAGRPKRVLSPTRVADLRVPSKISADEPEFTRLAPALDLARSLETPEVSPEIIVMTDGRIMDAARAAERVTPRTAFVPIGLARRDAPRILAVIHPPAVRPGETFDVVGCFAAGREGRARAAFNGESVDIGLVPGVESRHRWTAKMPDGLAHFVMSIADARAEIFVLPKSEKRRTLVLSGHVDSPAARALEGGAFAVDRSGPPALFDVVVLENRRAEEAPQEALKRFVEGGGGLVVLGGPNAYGPGGYAGTPIEAVLPVWATPREAATIVFAIDRSGSMAQTVGEKTKMQIAAEQVALGARALGGRDAVGIVAFAGEPQTVLAPGPAERVESRLRDLEPGGPTRIAPAVNEAARLLRAAKTPERFAIVVTDGETQETPAELERAFEELRADGFGAAVVLTAPRGRTPLESVFEKKLASAAEAKSVEGIAPALRALFAATRGWTIDAPGAVTAHEHAIARDMDKIPPPARMNRVELKPGADEILSSSGAPLLASGHYGLGRSVALTTAFEQGWEGAWSTWSDGGRLLRQAAAYAAGSGSLEPAAYRIDGDTLVVEWIGGDVASPGAARFDHADGIHSGLARVRVVSERAVETRVPDVRRGAYTIALEGAARRAIINVPTTYEERAAGIDAETLKRLGPVLRTPAELASFQPAELRAPAPSRLWLAASALILFLLDIAVAVLWK